MPSILSSCLILLKLAMAVNDGLHTMLSNVYSVIENAMQNDQDKKSVQESSSAPAFHRSKSQILEAFNRRRANLAIYDQTDVLVSNLTPFQEITISNKDVEGRRKTVSPIKNSPCKGTITRCNREVESNVETHFPEKSSLSNSPILTPSTIFSDTTCDSEDQSSCKADNRTQVEENKDLFKDSMDGPVETLVDTAGIQINFPTSKNISDSSTSWAPRSNKSPITESNFMKFLQESIPLKSKYLFRASTSSSNSKKPSPNNIWGSEVSGSTDNNENVTREIQSNSEKISLEDTVSEEFSAKVSKLYEDFFLDYCTGKDANTNLRAKGSNSNENVLTFANFTPMEMASNSPAKVTNSGGLSKTRSSFGRKTKPVPGIGCRDYTSDPTGSDSTGFGYFSDDKRVSRVSATKHIKPSKVPFSLRKDRWINMDDELNNPRCLQRMDETSKNNESNLEAHSKEFPTDSDNCIQPENELLSPLSSPFGADEDTLKISNDYLMIPNSSRRSILICEELDDSADLEVLGWARVGDLTKVLKGVGATAVLDELKYSEEDVSNLINNISDTMLEIGYSSAAETNSASANKILNFDNIPFADLDTEEKQINYLNNITDSCLKQQNGIKSRWESNFSADGVLSEDFGQRHEVMLETIANVCKNEMDLITRNTGADQLTDTGLETKFDIPLIEREATSNEDCHNTSVSSQTSSEIELDTFGLPFFVRNESKVKSTEHVPNENASFESGAFGKDMSNLRDGDADHSESSFSNDCRNNETSTPTSDEMLDKQNWVSINLSAESRREFDNVVSDDDKSHVSFKIPNSTFIEKDAIQSSIGNRMENELVCSPDVREGVTLEAKDWGNLAGEIYKSYLKCINILNMCDDETEDPNLKTKSNFSSITEDCKAKLVAEKTEPLCESEDLVKNDSCNDALPLESNETTNRSCSTTNSKHISNAGLKCEDLSFCKDKELDHFCNLNSSCDSDSGVNNSSSSHSEVNSGASVIEKCNPDSDKGNEKVEIKIADTTHFEMLPKPENASCSKEVSQNLSSDAAGLEELLSSLRSGFVKRSSNTQPAKPSIGNKDFEFLSNAFDKEVVVYLKWANSKNEKSKKDQSSDFADHSNYEFDLDQKLNSCPIIEQSMGETLYPSKSTPTSNIKALQQREQETTPIYDNEKIYDHEKLISTQPDLDLPPSDNSQNENFKYEKDVAMINSNEDGTLIEINNIQEVRVSSEGTTEVIDVTNCENSIEKDLVSETLN